MMSVTKGLNLGANSRVKRLFLRIGKLSRLTGMSCDALRFYERLGFIRAERTTSGYRDYPAEAVDLLQYVKTAKMLGFTLKEIGLAMPDMWSNPDRDAAVETVMRLKLEAVEARIGALTSLRDELRRRLMRRCPLRPALDALDA